MSVWSARRAIFLCPDGAHPRSVGTWFKSHERVLSARSTVFDHAHAQLTMHRASRSAASLMISHGVAGNDTLDRDAEANPHSDRRESLARPGLSEFGCRSRVAFQRCTRQPARRDGFVTRALAAQLSDRSVSRRMDGRAMFRTFLKDPRRISSAARRKCEAHDTASAHAPAT